MSTVMDLAAEEFYKPTVFPWEGIRPPPPRQKKMEQWKRVKSQMAPKPVFFCSQAPDLKNQDAFG